VDALNEFLTQGLVQILADMVTLVGIVAIMFFLNWRLALVSLATLPVLLVIVAIYQRFMRATYRLVRQRLAMINAYLNEQIGGVLVTQLFGRERLSKGHFAGLSAEYVHANMQSLLIFAIFMPTVQLMAAIGTAALLYWGGQGVLAGWASIGMLTAFVLYTERAFQPIRNLAERYTVLQAAMASAERVFGVLDTEEEVRDPERPAALPGKVRGEIAFNNVVFGYDPAEPVLKGISLTIPAGPARAAWWACWPASTTCSRAASPSTAWTSARCRSGSCAATSPRSPRTRYASRARSPATSACTATGSTTSACAGPPRW
jgi:ATP-binding cassette, subfamily B, multidrug efflux pump